MDSQKRQILDHIQKHGSITPNDADALFGCKRLSARIWDLIHKDGVNIKCKIEYGKTDTEQSAPTQDTTSKEERHDLHGH